jgi:hypothetical protein
MAAKLGAFLARRTADIDAYYADPLNDMACAAPTARRCETLPSRRTAHACLHTAVGVRRARAVRRTRGVCVPRTVRGRSPIWNRDLLILPEEEACAMWPQMKVPRDKSIVAFVMRRSMIIVGEESPRIEHRIVPGSAEESRARTVG